MVRIRLDKDKPLAINSQYSTGVNKGIQTAPSARQLQREQLKSVMDLYNRGKITDRQVDASLARLKDVGENSSGMFLRATQPRSIIGKGVATGLNIASVNPQQGFGNVLQLADTLTEKTPFKGVGDRLGRTGRNISYRYSIQPGGFADVSQNPVLNEVGKGLGVVGQTAQYATPYMGIYTMATQGAGTASDTIENLRAQGKGEWEAILKGVANATIQQAIERYSSKLQTRIPYMSALEKTMLGRLLSSAATEGGEEALQQVTDNLFNGRAWHEGVAQATVEGMKGGLILGGAFEGSRRLGVTDGSTPPTQQTTRSNNKLNQLENQKQDTLGALTVARRGGDTKSVRILHNQLKDVQDQIIKIKNNSDGFIRLSGKPTELAVTHNLSAANIAKAKELGGIPQPSLAIVKPNKSVVQGFGEATLIGNNALVDPKMRGNNTFASDVYSARQPRGQTLVTTPQAREAIYQQLQPYFDKTGESLALGINDSTENVDGRIATLMAYFDSKGISYPKFEDTYDYRSAMRKKLYDSQLEGDFQEWLNDLFLKSGAESKIWGGWTPSGRPRYLDDTVENALKEMRKAGIRSGEGGFQTGTAGELRSRVTPKFKSIADIVRRSDRLTTTAKMEAIKETTQNKFMSFVDKLSDYAVNEDSNRFIEFDAQLDAIGEFIKGDPEYFNQKFPNAPQTIKDEINAFKQELIDAPTEYFESVPNRAVNLSEFEVALIPENTDKKTRERLLAEGLELQFYKENKDGTNNRQERLIELVDRDTQRRIQAGEEDIAKSQGGYISLGGEDSNVEAYADVPKDQLIIRDGSGKAMSAGKPLSRNELESTIQKINKETEWMKSATNKEVKSLSENGRLYKVITKPYDIPASSPTKVPVEYVYRAVSDAELANIAKSGYIKSNGAMNVSTENNKGLTVFKDSNPSFYLPKKGGHILKIKVDPKNGMFYDSVDGYVKTPNKIPVSQIEEIDGSKRVVQGSGKAMSIAHKMPDGSTMAGPEHDGAVPNSTIRLTDIKDDADLDRRIKLMREGTIQNPIYSPSAKSDLANMSPAEAEAYLEAELAELEVKDGSMKPKRARELVSSMGSDNKITEAVRKANQEGKAYDFYITEDRNGRSIGVEQFDPETHRIESGMVIDSNENVLGNHLHIDANGITVNVGGDPVNISEIIGDVSDWDGKYKITQTMERNLERLAPNKETFQKTYRFLIGHKTQQEANFRKELFQQRKTLAENAKELQAARPSNVSKTEFNEDVFNYIENNLKDADLDSKYGDSANTIREYRDVTRDLYDTLLERVNTEYAKFGIEQVEARQDYITHISELMGKPSFVGEMFGRLQNSMLGEGMQSTRGNVPSDIKGRTENFEPRRRWNPFQQRRTNAQDFLRDPVKAVDEYLEPTLYNIYMTESVVRARALEAAFRAGEVANKMKRQDVSDELDEALSSLRNKGASNLTKGLQEYANALAGKTDSLDRALIDKSEHAALGLRAWQGLQRVGGRATILGNLQSTLAQTLGLPSTIADVGPINMLKGVARYASRDSIIQQSNFVQARLTRVNKATETKLQKIENAAGLPLQAMENEYIQATWYGEYEAALADGFTGQEAIIEADRRTERVVAGRGIADRPEIYRSTIANGFLQYTLEVNAQNQKFWKDFNKKQKANYMVSAFIMNSIMGAITGFEPLPDFIDAALKSFGEWTDEEDERSAKDKLVSTGQRFLGEVADMNPFIAAGATNILPEDQQKAIFGEESDIGRFQGQAAPLSIIERGVDAAFSLAEGDTKGARDDIIRLLPGGNQIKKTLTGAELIQQGYATDYRGNPTYEAPTSPVGKAQVLAFGPYSSPEARQYYNQDSAQSGPSLKVTQARADGLPSKENLTSQGNLSIGAEGRTEYEQAQDMLRQAAKDQDYNLDELVKKYGAPSEINSYAKLTAYVTGRYEDYAEAYNLNPATPSTGSGEFSNLVERDMAGEKISKAKSLLTGYPEIPDNIKEQFYREAGVTKQQLEYDIAAGFNSNDKADYLAELLANMPYEQRLQTLAKYREASLSGDYLANPKTLDLLADMGLITEDDADALADMNYENGQLVARSSSSGRRSGGRSRSSGARSAISIARQALQAPNLSINSNTPTIKIDTTPNVSIKRSSIRRPTGNIS